LHKYMTGKPGGSNSQASDGLSWAGKRKMAGRDGGVMASMKSLMLGAAILAGAAAIGATNANAAEIGIYFGTPSAYAAPYPGPGYTWIEGYYDQGYWIPGRWAYAGRYDRDDYYRGRDWDRHHDWDRDRYYGRDRHYDRDDRHHDRDRDWDRDHDRFRR
jgi:hypothetical protein